MMEAQIRWMAELAVLLYVGVLCLAALAVPALLISLIFVRRDRGNR